MLIGDDNNTQSKINNVPVQVFQDNTIYIYVFCWHKLEGHCINTNQCNSSAIVLWVIEITKHVLQLISLTFMAQL